MEEPCFDFLRTKKTLGYTVFPMCRCTYGIIGSSITVRSQRDKFTVEQVHHYVKDFLKEFKKILKNMKSAEFEGMPFEIMTLSLRNGFFRTQIWSYRLEVD